MAFVVDIPYEKRLDRRRADGRLPLEVDAIERVAVENARMVALPVEAAVRLPIDPPPELGDLCGFLVEFHAGLNWVWRLRQHNL